MSDKNDKSLGTDFGFDPNDNWPSAERQPKSASPPFPRMPAPWLTDRSTEESLERAIQHSTEFFTKYAGSKEIPVRFHSYIDRIVRGYWADRKYDNQLSAPKIKEFLGKISTNIEQIQHSTRRYPPLLKGELDARLKAIDRDETKRLGLDDLDRLLRDLGVVIKRYSANVKSGKIEATAVSKCCDALAALWEREVGRRHAGNFVERVCIAVDPDLTSKQISWRLKKSRQAQKQKK